MASRSGILLSLGAALLLLAAPAAASPLPQFFFLADVASDVPGVPTPAGPIGGSDPTQDGLLYLYDFKAANLPNATAPQTREVVVGTDQVAIVKFATEAEGTLPARLLGSPVLALWTGPSPVVHANLTVILYEMKADGTLAELTSGSIAMDADLNKTPDPMSLIPPTPNPDPAHPENAVVAAALYELAQVAPVVLHPPVAIKMKAVDAPFAPTSRLALGFRLDPNPAPVQQPNVPPTSLPAPVPVGAAVQLQYNAILSPSYLYVPWSVNPTATSTTTHASTSSTPTTTCLGACGPAGSSGTSTTGKSSPMPTVTVMATVLVAAAFLLRRRLD